MIRSVEITLDRASWPPPGVPGEIDQLEGLRDTDVLLALLHTALWTRPPVRYGFHLCDLWACFRYYPAIADTPRLRLRQEWEDIDPHQKTILSDELGVGFTTELLSSELGVISYADTQFFVNVVAPEEFALGRGTRVGPRKSPDYIALDENLEYSVLECKGTQTSQDVLLQAIETGVAQKQNLSTQGTSQIKHSLVAGLFIPKWSNGENARIHIREPDWEVVRVLLSEMVSPEVAIAGVLQVSLGKHFALMGLSHTAEFLSMTKTSQLRSLPMEARDELRRLEGEGRGERREISIDLPVAGIATTPPADGATLLTAAEEKRIVLRRFSMQILESTLSRLLRSDSLVRELHSLASEIKGKRLSARHDETSATLESPLGFTFSLEGE